MMLHIAGDGPQREYLKNLSARLGIAENVIFGENTIGNLKILFAGCRCCNLSIYI